MESLSFKPNVVHCHDWQAGLVPALLKGPYGIVSNLAGTPSVFTIHNMGYQGLFPEEKMAVTGLPKEAFFHPEGLEYWGKISLLKAGIVYSDTITTVSPRYAREIQTSEYGMGMEDILRQRRDLLHGILNGIDYRLWNPYTDKHLTVNYSLENPAGKIKCKASLIEEMGLDSDLADQPLLGLISRLDAQKGCDLLVNIIDDVLDLDVGLVILGSGDEKIQMAIKESVGRHVGRVGIFLGFNEPLAHRIMAGADIFLIPSRYEPCGLTQMYALKYGTVPVVRATGGLDDTIVQFNHEKGEGNGFKFGPYESGAFLSAIREAVDHFRLPETWRKIMINGMKKDFSWDQSARNYLELYVSLTN